MPRAHPAPKRSSSTITPFSPWPGMTKRVDLSLAAAGRRQCTSPLWPDFGNGQVVTDLAGKQVWDLGVARHGFDGPCLRVTPQRVLTTLAFKIAAVLAQVMEQGAFFDLTVTVSSSASGGSPRRASCRLSSRMRAIASARLARASSLVSPCPFAPGISGQ
jgi:hypothetical protein